MSAGISVQTVKVDHVVVLEEKQQNQQASSSGEHECPFKPSGLGPVVIKTLACR